MESVYRFLIRNDVWIYIVSALGLFWYVTEFIRAQATLRRAMFNLERETGTRARNHALSFILFFAAVIGIVYYVNRNIAPTLPAEVSAAVSPTPDVFATPLASPTPLGTPLPPGEIGVAPVLAPTVTFPAEPGAPQAATGTPEATLTAAATPFETCNDALTFTEPLNGSVAFQRIRFRGTANTGELHQYVIEMNGPQTVGAWAPITQEPVNQPIIDGDLAEANLSEYEAGPYLVRLRALDAGGGLVGTCQIQVTLDN